MACQRDLPHQAVDGSALNAGLPGQGSPSRPPPLRERIDAAVIGLQAARGLVFHAECHHGNCLGAAVDPDSQEALHGDTLDEHRPFR